MACYVFYNMFSEMKWCSSITGFKNLEKLEISIYFDQVRRDWATYYNPYLEMIQEFLENPMPKMKEFKLNTINAFFQDEFLIHLPDIFPNLETFNLVKLGLQGEMDESRVPKNKKYSYWRFDNFLDVLKSLGSLKNLSLPSMELVLAPWNENFEHTQSIRETGHVFNEALQIIKNQFPVSLGDLKITDGKYGYVILKEKMKKPKMFNQMTANDRPVKEIIQLKGTKKVRLKLKPKRKQKGMKKNNANVEEIELSEELIKTLYKNYVDNDS